MKDSGIEWIGEIPEHWEVKKMKDIFQKLRTGTTPSTANQSNFDGEINWFNPGDLNRFKPEKSKKTITKKAIDRGEAKIFAGDSVMIVGIGATSGKTSYLAESASFNQQITAFQSNTESNLFHAYSVSNFATVMLETASFTTLPILNNQFFKSFFLPSPPVPEQIKIIKKIEFCSSQIQKAIDHNQRSIKKLREYRATLIDSAVTGKIDVREPVRNS